MDNENQVIRAFICIEMSDEAIKEIARVQEILENKLFIGKFTELGNLHLTLKFLGEIDYLVLEKVKEKLKSIKFKNFEVELSHLGVFSSQGNPRIVWAKLNGSGIWKLQKEIDETLSILIGPDKIFTPHITLARIKYVKARKDFIEYVKNVSTKKIKFSCKSFKLKSSILKMNGPIYTTLEEYKLNE